ncbi:replication initiator, partial [Longimycelium tulufanense]|uniref:replication initiator n=1 Tax=Longimycelium tulufanense TaxID=907463 RepID=UPI003570FEAB
MTGRGVVGPVAGGVSAAGVPDQDAQLVTLMRSPGFRVWRQQVKATGGCAKPVRLFGEWALENASGARLEEYRGGLLVACNNRRSSVCEPCSARYEADAFHLVCAGMVGGKGVPERVGR